VAGPRGRDSGGLRKRRTLGRQALLSRTFKDVQTRATSHSGGVSLVAGFEQGLAQDQDLDQDLTAACWVIREWLTLEQAAASSMN
jgi:hypothetical protein